MWKIKVPELRLAVKSFGIYALLPLASFFWFFFRPGVQFGNVLLGVSGTIFAIIVAVAAIIDNTVRDAIEYWIGRVIRRPGDYELAKERFDTILCEIGRPLLGSAFLTLCVLLSILITLCAGDKGLPLLWIEIFGSLAVASLVIAVCYFFLFARQAMYISLINELRRLPPPPTYTK